MIVFYSYLVKVMLCSGILFGYYLLALRDKPHHRWNRFFLLAATTVSMVIPLLRFSFPWESQSNSGSTQWVQLLQVVNDNEHFIEEASIAGTGSTISWLSLAYMAFSIILMVRLIYPYLRLTAQVHQANLKKVDGFTIVSTTDAQSPFTLFRYIFWNEHLDLHEPAARQVLEHEKVHVREGHSLDKLFLNASLVVFWPVPFLWLIRRELGMVHEFIADESSFPGQDTASFAAMVLQAAYPGHPLDLTSSFFQSPIKRRVRMLMKNHSCKTGHIGRWMTLPIILLIAAAFTLRPNTTHSINTTGQHVRKITVVIDAGHGGSDAGVNIAKGTQEKDLTLSIARKIKSLNSNDSLDIILTRYDDITMGVKERVEFALGHHADAFISIHMNAAPEQNDQSNGMEMYISARNRQMEQQSILLGSLLGKRLSQSYTVAKDLKKREKPGVWVLDAPDILYPAVLLECGYLTNPKDLTFLLEEKNQTAIAKDILKALEYYTDEWDRTLILDPNYKNQALFILDGKELPAGTTADNLNNKIKAEDIDRIDVLKGDSAIHKYGSKGKYGVIEITSKIKAARDQ